MDAIATKEAHKFVPLKSLKLTISEQLTQNLQAIAEVVGDDAKSFAEQLGT
jgi:hypothetical protein